MYDSSDVCSAKNMQFEQDFLRLSLSEPMSAHDWGDGIGHFCVMKYLVEFNPMHPGNTLHEFWSLAFRYFFRPPDAPDVICVFLNAYAQLGSTLTISGERDAALWL
jgi:hypothetical protein